MTVGCATHTARIIDRGGATVTEAYVLTEVEWTRVLDEVSTASITVAPSGDCCERLRDIRSWRHKLAIWRDGQPVWEGPVVDIDWTAAGVEVRARDILAWLDRRVPHENKAFRDADLTDIAAWLIADGYAPDDPGHQVEVIGWSQVRGDRGYTRDVGQTGDHLRDLARTGLDYTAVGSTIVLLPEDHLFTVGSLTDADFPEGLIVAEDGASLGTRWIVHGGQGVKGVAGGVHEYYGLLERAVQESSILDSRSAEAAALSRLRGSLPVPVFVDSQQVTLSPDAPVDVPLLVPGWCVDVATTATCRTVTQRLKIVGVRVTETGGSGGGQPGGESVQVQLAPTGAGGTAELG